MPKSIELGVRLTADGKGFIGAVTVSEKAVRKGLSPRVRGNLRAIMRTCAAGCASMRGWGLTAWAGGQPDPQAGEYFGAPPRTARSIPMCAGELLE